MPLLSVTSAFFEGHVFLVFWYLHCILLLDVYFLSLSLSLSLSGSSLAPQSGNYMMLESVEWKLEALGICKNKNAS